MQWLHVWEAVMAAIYRWMAMMLTVGDDGKFLVLALYCIAFRRPCWAFLGLGEISLLISRIGLVPLTVS